MATAPGSVAAARNHAGYRLTCKYSVPHADIAFLLGMKEKNYLTRLRRLGIDADVNTTQRLPGLEEILARIRAELMRLTEEGRVPDKGAVDALVSLARALKTVIELERENIAPPVADTGPASVSPEELREALARIDRRIDELANLRAAEIIQRRLDGSHNNGSGQGVVLSGP
ncbi:hypothetical protein [Phyllobacterium leguminum]|uniref:Uncharacterized protein n=1 Tax=Phyllobacterium leguminum TaxID=314237 RepID=A0A318T1V3_9HYPH|nr:hypothetical protein [Phyllobacterium leguminum]PYE88380.1 hypothetical protein C7477_10722 [Phyllobacterium leguminum]